MHENTTHILNRMIVVRKKRKRSGRQLEKPLSGQYISGWKIPRAGEKGQVWDLLHMDKI